MESKSTSHLIGGFFGGLTSSVTLQPFDLLKTRLQQNHEMTLTKTFKELNSIKSLWRGTLPSAIRTSVGSALYLSSLNLFRSTLARNTGQNSSVTTSALPKLSTELNLLTGFITRAMVGFITMPITIIKVRFESSLYNYKSITQAIQDIYQKEGSAGFLKGSGATIARDAPYAGIYVGLYEWWKLSLSRLIKNDSGMANFQTSTVINSSSALLAASLATTITAPFDTIKTRMQLQPKKFQHFNKTFMTLIKNEGWRSLFDGLSLRLTRKAMSAGIAWGIYEEIIKLT